MTAAWRSICNIASLGPRGTAAATAHRDASKFSRPGLPWRAHQAGEMSRFVNQEKVSCVVEVFSREILSGELELDSIVADR